MSPGFISGSLLYVCAYSLRESPQFLTADIMKGRSPLATFRDVDGHFS